MCVASLVAGAVPLPDKAASGPASREAIGDGGEAGHHGGRAEESGLPRRGERKIIETSTKVSHSIKSTK